MSKVPSGDHPTRHASSHHSDHSGAHVRGTSHHEKHAHNPHDGLTKAEGGTESTDSEGFSKKGNEGKSDKSLSEHPTSMELPAVEHDREE